MRTTTIQRVSDVRRSAGTVVKIDWKVATSYPKYEVRATTHGGRVVWFRAATLRPLQRAVRSGDAIMVGNYLHVPFGNYRTFEVQGGER